MSKKFFYFRSNLFINGLFSIFCFIGIIDTFLLVYGELFLDQQCISLKFFPNNCGYVIKSDYGVLFGLPLGVIGLVGYSSLLAFFILSLRQKTFLLTLIFESFLGLIFSIYLVYLQGFILLHWCFFCILSAISMTIIFFCSVFLAFCHREKIKFKEYFPKIGQKSIYFFLIILATILAIFESVRSRKWLDNTKKEEFILHPQCQLFSQSYPFATIDQRLVTIRELDHMIFEEDSATCQKIKNMREQILNMLIIEKEIKEKQKNNNIYHNKNVYQWFFLSHGITLPQDHKINNISSFIQALDMLNKRDREKIEKEFLHLRVKHKVIINNFH